MTDTFKSGRWLGYAALTCVLLLFLATRLNLGQLRQESLYILALISLLVFGIYCGVRGLFSGTWWNRICAGISLVYLIWMLFLFFGGA
jgi:hypothetical protein